MPGVGVNHFFFFLPKVDVSSLGFVLVVLSGCLRDNVRENGRNGVFYGSSWRRLRWLIDVGIVLS